MIYHRQDRASCRKLLLSQLWDLKEMPQIVWCWRRWLRWRPWLEEGQASAFLVFTRQSMGLLFSSSAQCIIQSVYIAQCMYVPCLPLDVWCTLLEARSIVPTIFLLQLFSLHVNSGFYRTHCIGIPVDADTVMPGSCCTHKAEFVSPTWSWIDPHSWFRPNTFEDCSNTVHQMSLWEMSPRAGTPQLILILREGTNMGQFPQDWNLAKITTGWKYHFA